MFIAETWIVVLKYCSFIGEDDQRVAELLSMQTFQCMQCLNTICTVITILDLDKISFNLLRLIISFCSYGRKLGLI